MHTQIIRTGTKYTYINYTHSPITNIHTYNLHTPITYTHIHTPAIYTHTYNLHAHL